ncbi:MAG: hypothetical protein LBU32_32265 [Clostridiales bacterium]|jgi:hypothetical protein|nr:hypothetical protein [Clostridiales bacterium]
MPACLTACEVALAANLSLHLGLGAIVGGLISYNASSVKMQAVESNPCSRNFRRSFHTDSQTRPTEFL